MGKIFDASRIKEVHFPYLYLDESDHGYSEGAIKITASHNDSLDLSIWKPGAYIIGVWEESEGDWGHLVTVSEEQYNAWMNDKWQDLPINKTEEEKKHLDGPGYEIIDGHYKEKCTNRQVIVEHIDIETYKELVKNLYIKEAYKHLRNEILVQIQDESLPSYFKETIKKLCDLTDSKARLFNYEVS